MPRYLSDEEVFGFAPAAPAASPYSPEDRDFFIRTLIGEAGGEPDEGIAGVGHVILSRLKSGKYGDSIKAVVQAPSQFEAWSRKGGPAYTASPQSPGYQKIAAIADRLLAGETDDPTGGADHFYAPKGMPNGQAPSWAGAMTPAADIGGHRFFKSAQAAERPPAGDAGPRLLSDEEVFGSAPPAPVPLSKEEAANFEAQHEGEVPGFLKSANDAFAGILGGPASIVRQVHRQFGNETPLEDYPGTGPWLRNQGAKINVTHPAGVKPVPGDYAGSMGKFVGETVIPSLMVPGLGLMGQGVKAAQPIVHSVAKAAAATSLPAAIRGAVTRGAAAASDAAANLGKMALDAAVRSPLAWATAELGTAAAAGAGGEYAQQEFGDQTPMARMWGEIIGGLAPAAAGHALFATGRGIAAAGEYAGKKVYGAAKWTPGVAIPVRAAEYGVIKARNLIQKITMTPSERASARLRETVADPDEAMKRIETPDGEVFSDLLSPSQRMGDEDLIALERAVFASNKGLQETDKARIGASMRESLTRIQEKYANAPKDSIRAQIQRNRAVAEATMQARVEAAEAGAAAQSARLGTEQTVEGHNLALRQRMDEAYTTAEKPITPLFEEAYRLGADVSSSPARSRQRLKELAEELGEEQAKDMPEIARRLLGARGSEKKYEPGFYPGALREKEPADKSVWAQENVPLRHMQRLRSELLQEARNAAAGSGSTPASANRARVAGELADALLDDMGAASGRVTGAAGAALREALDYTRVFHEKFTKGVVGDILGQKRTGAEAVDPALTLEQTGLAGIKGKVVADRISEALQLGGQPAEAMTVVARGYLFTKFRFAAVDPTTDEINPGKAQRFLARHREILAAQPQLKQELDQIIASGRGAVDIGDEARRFMANMDDPKKLDAYIFLRQDPDTAIPALLRPDTPRFEIEARFADVRKQVDEDPTGAALLGLKSSFADHLLNTSRAGGALAEAGVPVSGQQLLAKIADERTAAAMRHIFSPDEIRRWQIGASTLARIEKYAATKPAEEVITNAQTAVERVVSQFIGVKLGKHVGEAVGAGSIQAPGIGSTAVRETKAEAARRAAELVLREAFLDKDRFRDLMQPHAKRSEVDAAVRRAQGWLWNLYNEWGESAFGAEEPRQ